MNALTPLHLDEPNDPAELGYPPTLPIEIALRIDTPKNVCAAYGIGREEWERLSHDPVFLADLKATVEELKKEGMSFKMKARLQSEELLKTSWKMIHSAADDVPSSVKADLIKFTIRAAGLDGSKDQGGASAMVPMQIQINLR